MTTRASWIRSLASFKKQSSFLVTFALQVVSQGRIGVFRQAVGKFIQAREKRAKVGLGVGAPHAGRGEFQFPQCEKNLPFEGAHAQDD
jgi:hypothetical protein